MVGKLLVYCWPTVGRQKTNSRPIDFRVALLHFYQTKVETTYKTPSPTLERKEAPAGLSLRAGGRGFSLATKRVAPGYFYWKIEEK